MHYLLTLPDEIKWKILSYVTYDEITKLRVLSKDMNRVCMDKLNTGFTYAENLHAAVQKEVRSKLPRRESERRDHAFSRHADILSAIETRMSLLQITYAKYIEAGYSCFIPGRVLDELFRVIKFVRTAKEPPRSHEVLMELRDISSMAMEHFEEKILPPIKKRLACEGVTVLPGGLTVGVEVDNQPMKGHSPKRSATFSPLRVTPAKRRRMSPISFDLSQSFTKPSPSNDSLASRLTESERVIALQGQKIEEQERALEDMKRKLSDYNHRFNDLADVLRSHNASTLVHEKITALIQPMRDADTPPRNTEASGALGEGSSSTYTSVFSRGQYRRYGKHQKTPEQRAKLLKEGIDRFKDEYKL